MPTARDFCTLALKEAGVVGVGQTPLAEDINDAFTLLNRMIAQWQKKRWLVPNLYSISKVANGAKSNLIGPGQFYNAARPDKIQAAYFRQLTGAPSPNDVTFPLTWITSWEDYSRVMLKNLASWPQYFFYDAAFPYGNVYIWPIPDATYEVSLVLKGPIGFTTQIEDGQFVNQGSAYTDGVYVAVPIVSVTGFGSGATANVTIFGGIVTVFEIQDKGDGYKINDQLSLNPADVGGTGTDFLWKVTNVTDDLNAEFNMPPEYEEAIHYNLCVRLTSMYSRPPNPVQGVLATNGLNTIRNANAQVPQLRMPNALRFNRNRAGSFYIFNADAQ